MSDLNAQLKNLEAVIECLQSRIQLLESKYDDSKNGMLQAETVEEWFEKWKKQHQVY